VSPSPEHHPRLRVRDVRRAFGRRVVLDGIDLDVLAGQVVLLAGDNGSGKTTLLRCIAGLARYDGRITLDGTAAARTAASRAAIGYLPQTVGLPAWATVAETMTLFERLRGATIDEVDLPDGFLPPWDQPVGQLSGGQRQRVALAITLLGAPRLLLLDEPSANLDRLGRDGLATLVRSVASEGTSVLIAAPSPSDLGLLPDRMVRLVDGQVVAGPQGLGDRDVRATAADATGGVAGEVAS
jgi:ABC-type multidrug transport system ATPase subunit